MTVIISDIKDIAVTKNDNVKLITDNGKIKNCIGCFGCWVKTPGQCVIKDGYENTGALLGKCDRLIIVNECTYGGYSPFVKNVLDRAISYISPHFATRNNEMHHKRRYSNVIGITACFYGGDITEAEKSTAQEIVRANSVNYDGNVDGVLFFGSADEVRGYINEYCVD